LLTCTGRIESAPRRGTIDRCDRDDRATAGSVKQRKTPNAHEVADQLILAKLDLPSRLRRFPVLDVASQHEAHDMLVPTPVGPYAFKLVQAQRF
jgi:hypothetical protein